MLNGCSMQMNRVIMAVLLGSALSGRAAALDSRGVNEFSNLPLAALPKVSAELGRNFSAYRIQPQAAGFHATDARHRVSVDFTVEGLAVRSGAAEWRMKLCSYGYGSVMKPAAATRPDGGENRVQYRRGPITEWYVNGPVGLEQGFTITEPPGKADGEPLTLALTISGNLTAVDEGHQELSLIDREGSPKLRYSGLIAYDSTGKKLPAWLQLQDKQLLLKVAGRDARYPIVVDPWIQTAELTASDGAADDQFGWSVAVSGNTVVVGAPFHALGSQTDRGTAYVFVMPDNGWADMTQTAELAASDGAANDYFGSSVAISGDTVAVGAGGATVNGDPHQGAAYIFTKLPNGWTNMTQTAKLIASDGYVGDDFGASVAISGDTVTVGAPYASIGSNSQQGAAYVFTKPGNGWADMTQTPS